MKIMTKKQLQPNQFYQLIQFLEQLVNPDLWIAKADELLNAAGILKGEVIKYWSEVRVENQTVSSPNTKIAQGPYFLLIAYALENYFKALLIHRNRKSLKNRLLSKLPRWLNEHDPVKLAHGVQLTLDITEEELLSRLSQNSIWKARYPVPTNPDGLFTSKKFSNGQVGLTAYFGPNDVTRIESFIDRLNKYLFQEIKNDNN